VVAGGRRGAESQSLTKSSTEAETVAEKCHPFFGAQFFDLHSKNLYAMKKDEPQCFGAASEGSASQAKLQRTIHFGRWTFVQIEQLFLERSCGLESRSILNSAMGI
jgi:hypothetical protein